MVKYSTSKDLELKNPRLFSERANLNFSFIYNNGESGRHSSFKVRVPLYENPSINETKQSRLGTYKPIGRNSDLYAFLGAESTSLVLSFNLTLPHIMYQCEKISITDYTKVVKPDDKESFKINKQKTNQPVLDPKNIINVIKDFQNNFFYQTSPPETQQDILQDILLENTNIFATGQSRPVGFTGPQEAPVSEKETKIKALYYFWTNIIRCSVIGTSDHVGGPPIVRLNYGPLYKGVPFIVKKYQFQIDEKAGYDITTLLPLRLQVTLTMDELRVGNFSSYKTYDAPGSFGTLADADNVAGWEYVLANGSLDPIYSSIEEES